LPEDEGTWEALHVVFATSRGNVRRNRLSDFANIRANGLIAMKLEEENEQLVGVSTCSEDMDFLLATRDGKVIRFPVSDVRVFSGRTSTGVRGIKLADGDGVVTLSMLTHVDASPGERAAYLKAKRERGLEMEGDMAPEADGETADEVTLPPGRYEELEALEQYILTVSNSGFGKRTSSYEYRLAGRGGQGIWNMEMGGRNGSIVAAFPVNAADQVMMVTDRGQVIRMPVHDVRIAGRKTQGVTLFRIDGEEHVVSVASIADDQGDTGQGDTGQGDTGQGDIAPGDLGQGNLGQGDTGALTGSGDDGGGV
jgi:DNA gyrase subunit A